jgi:hypothetical protein
MQERNLHVVFVCGEMDFDTVLEKKGEVSEAVMPFSVSVWML